MIIAQDKDKSLCKVVAIISRVLSQIVGKIEYDDKKDMYILKPANKKIGKMYINKSDMKEEWLKKIGTSYFLVEFKSWEVSDDHAYCRVIG